MPLVQLTQALLKEGGSGNGGDVWGLVIQIGLILAIFYVLLIRPQQKRAKDHQKMLNALKRDQEVITTGGVYGRITGLTEQVVTLEVAPNVRLKVQRSQIAAQKSAESGSKSNK